ncbi:MAG: sigma-70 family RNA polymerase sigma factor [Planctomycetes bacterium]|nr:sigma-70 family RNA polymerase sigma factor [Planctomycetota bacterium]
MDESTSPVEQNAQRTREFMRLLGLHEVDLRSYVLALVPNWADAEEILQDTRLRLWDQFDKHDPAKDFGGWSRSIAYFFVLTMRKKRGRHPQFERQEFCDVVSQAFAESAGQSAERSHAIQYCLDKLDEAKRTAVIRYYSGQETIAAIAADLGRPIEALKAVVRRARLKLAECVEKQLSQESDA